MASTRVTQLIIISDLPSYHNLAQAPRPHQFRKPEKVLETPRSKLRRRRKRPYLRQLSACQGDQSLQSGPTEEISTAIPFIYTDLVGPINPVGFSGERYFFTFTDDCTRYTETYTGSKKSDWLKCLKTFHSLCRTRSKQAHPIERL